MRLHENNFEELESSKHGPQSSDNSTTKDLRRQSTAYIKGTIPRGSYGCFLMLNHAGHYLVMRVGARRKVLKDIQGRICKVSTGIQIQCA